MATPARHFKFINSKTGNTIYYYTITEEKDQAAITEELDKIRDQVAVNNAVFMETIYWEEIKSDTY